MHDHLELRQLLQDPANDESEQHQAGVQGLPEEEIVVAFGADEVQHHRRGRMDPHGQPALGRTFIAVVTCVVRTARIRSGRCAW